MNDGQITQLNLILKNVDTLLLILGKSNIYSIKKRLYNSFIGRINCIQVLTVPCINCINYDIPD